MTDDGHSDEDLVLRYVSQGLELRDGGADVSAEQLCAAHPHLVERVRDVLDSAGGLVTIDRSAQDFDPLARRLVGGRYRLEERVGAGAMGVVYRAVDIELRRVVAVKVLQTGLFGGGSTEAEARFAREAEVLAALQHPSVVTVFDRGTTEDGVMFLVMELLQGESLAHLLEDQARTSAPTPGDDTGWLVDRLGGTARMEKSWLRQVVAWAADLAAGLAAAHHAGVLHRDVKPSNVFVDVHGRARLLDFGIAARVAHPTLDDRRQGGLGTPAYMAPEQVDPDVPVAPTLDVYGLTATLYHAITLRPPYQGTPSQVIAGLQRREPLAAYSLRPGLPRDLQAILDRGMARRASARYPTATDLEADLRRFLAYQPVSARARTPLGRVCSRLARSPAARLVGAAVLVALATMGWIWWSAHLSRVRAARWVETWAALPPNFGLSPRMGNRVVTEPVEFDALRALFDRAVADCADPVPSQLFRAAFRLDHGDVEGAQRDMAAVVAFEPTAYGNGLGACYRALPADARGARALDLEHLADPSTPRDCYLAAYHALRLWATADAPARARSLLDRRDLDEWPPAQDLLGTLLLAQATVEDRVDRGQALETYRRLHELAIALETRLGRRTATTAKFLGSALLGERRYAEALSTLEEGVSISLWSYGLQNNLALAYRRGGKPALARDLARDLVARRPAMLVGYVTLVGACLDLADYEAARATVDAMPLPDDDAGRRERAYRHGLVEHAYALALMCEGRECREQAARAEALLREYGRDTDELRVASALATGNVDLVLSMQLDLLERDPLDPAGLDSLRALLPREADTLLTARLRELLARQSVESRRARGGDPTPGSARPNPPDDSLRSR
ncbi:MAG: protein kinase [Planctomycetota bacterium]